MAFLKIAAFTAAVITATPTFAVDLAHCEYEARVWAGTVWHMEARLKVPIWAGVGFLAGGPGVAAWMAVLAANAESPRERRMVQDYTAWCMGWRSDPPVVPRRWLEVL